ncbi:MAG: CheR family methyltransferase [Methylococcales bacterium]
MPNNTNEIIPPLVEPTIKNEKILPIIVGIGASAGGLEAFEQFFRHAPIDSGMAFVLVPHLDPSHASLLTEILQRTTAMPVVEALNKAVVKANYVYVIPPNRDMKILNGKLQLSVPKAPRGQRMPIDAFFSSLAEDQAENAVGVILSGTGTDGTLGFRAIFGVGGVTLAQEPNTAKYDGMPQSAIQSGCVTHVLPVEEMLAVLRNSRKNLVVQTTLTRPKSAPAKEIDNILLHLRSITGHDFSLYKKSTIGRRIERRMLQHSIDDTEQYANYIKEHPAEAHILFRELLINVTCFFRDTAAFEVLEKKILPELVKNKTKGDVFRVWISGCSTGEEAYSVAILLRELLDETRKELKIQIYGTDLDDDAIDKARAGIYPINIAQDITPERLHRFFVKEENSYRIKKEIREMIVFAIQNVIKDPPFTKLDFLSCRNLMIYLTPELQDRLITAFHYALKPEGVLFLSPSESVGNHTNLFSAINHKWKFYRAINTTASSRTMMTRPLAWAAVKSGDNEVGVTPMMKETNFAELTRRVLIQFFAPASVVTDLNGNILYVHGDTGRYLRPAPGHATLNIIEMAREGLDLELRSGLYLAASQGEPAINREIQVKTNGGFSTVNLTIRALPDSNGIQKQLLVSFQDVPTPVTKTRRKYIIKPAELTRIEELERDLAYVKESHQFNNEEQQASNEELKSTNEELQSTNEELQSTNEELETSKEELQSVNEEMITVNSELQGKIEQLADIQNDMKNLLDTINVGILFLDRNLLIRRFTREATKIYRLAESDVGRSLNDIRCMAEGDDLLVAAQQVLDSLIPYEREMSIGNDEWILARIQPYRTLDNVIDGVVLTFTNITSRVKAIATEDALILAEGIVNTIREPFVVLDGNLNIVFASRTFYRIFKTTQEEAIERSIYTIGDKQWDTTALHELFDNILEIDKPLDNYEIYYNFPIIGKRLLTMNARRIVGKVGIPKMILLSIFIRWENPSEL